MLRARGLYPEPAKIDGDFGEITEAGVKAFQEFADLEPDGIVGPLTWRALAAADVKLPVAAGGEAAAGLTATRRDLTFGEEPGPRGRRPRARAAPSGPRARRRPAAVRRARARRGRSTARLRRSGRARA